MAKEARHRGSGQLDHPHTWEEIIICLAGVRPMSPAQALSPCSTGAMVGAVPGAEIKMHRSWLSGARSGEPGPSKKTEPGLGTPCVPRSGNQHLCCGHHGAWQCPSQLRQSRPHSYGMTELGLGQRALEKNTARVLIPFP